MLRKSLEKMHPGSGYDMGHPG